MTDVRSLLRQQRAARRITHPYAAYSDAGKLLCVVCHEQVKVESLWVGHLRSPAHEERVQKLQASRPTEDQTAASNKRKHGGDDDDVSMADEDEDESRKKRSRQDVNDAEPGHDAGTGHKDGATDNTTPTRLKPPTPRRTSGTPSQGVEIQIPSRPATPVVVRTDFQGVPGSSAVASLLPLVPQKESSALAGFVPASRSAPSGRAGAAATNTSFSGKPEDKQGQGVDEDEWAAFEADLLHSNTNGMSGRPAISAPEDAVITAPAMTAEELAAKSAEEERERRRATADVDLENEKEEATRALEEEFEDMEELEARVRRLKERREALRHQQGSPPLAAAVGLGDRKGNGAVASDSKENAGEVGQESEDDDDDDEDADDWAGFRFTGR